MKPEEATKILKSTLSLIYQTNISFEDSVDYKEASDIAIRAIKEVQQYREIGSVGEIKQAIGVLSLSENDIIKTFHELNEYRKIGTVEQVKNQKENLNVAYQIINDYEQYGTIEDFKMAQRYMRLVKSHGTIGQVNRMRLIDADKINFEEVFGGQSDFAKDLRETAQKLIDRQPTAFDKERVIKELEYDKEISQKYSTGLKEQGHIEAFDEAISIIKKGGIK